MLLNLFYVLQLLFVSWQANYDYKCQPVNYSNDPLEVRIAWALWLFYISKLLEFVDTLFFIVRKKFKQLTFLHVYHHSTMFCFWWIGVKWVAGGSGIFVIISIFKIVIIFVVIFSLHGSHDQFLCSYFHVCILLFIGSFPK